MPQRKMTHRQKHEAWTKAVQDFDKHGGSQNPSRRQLFECARSMHARLCLLAETQPEDENLWNVIDEIEADMGRVKLAYASFFDEDEVEDGMQ